MSILNENGSTQGNPARKAARIKHLNLVMANQMIKSWNEGWDLIWSDENPQAVLDALGEDAGEVFDINEANLVFLSNVLTGRRQPELDAIFAKVAAKPNTQTDENGNVTII